MLVLSSENSEDQSLHMWAMGELQVDTFAAGPLPIVTEYR